MTLTLDDPILRPHDLSIEDSAWFHATADHPNAVIYQDLTYNDYLDEDDKFVTLEFEVYHNLSADSEIAQRAFVPTIHSHPWEDERRLEWSSFLITRIG